MGDFPDDLEQATWPGKGRPGDDVMRKLAQGHEEADAVIDRLREKMQGIRQQEEHLLLGPVIAKVKEMRDEAKSLVASTSAEGPAAVVLAMNELLNWLRDRDPRDPHHDI